MRASLLAVFAALVTLAACAAAPVPPGADVASAHVAEDSFVAADGARLPMRQWLPTEPARAVVVAVHGFNDYAHAFDKVPGAPGVGPFLAERGIAVFAYDQRGFGRAPNHGLWPGRAALTGDFKAFAVLIRARYPGVPLYALGESMGGAVIMAALAAADPPTLDGAILSAPAVWSRATMPAYYRVALWLGAHLLPGIKPSGQSLGRQASDNVAMLRDNGRDPLFIKATRIDAISGLVDLMDDALGAAGHLHGQVLYLYGRNDQIIPPQPSAQAIQALLAADPAAVSAFYDTGWHMMLRDKSAAVVLGDIAAFIDDPKGPLPSGADREALPRLQAALKK